MQFVFAIGLMLVSYIIQAVIQPKPTKPKPTILTDDDFPQIDEGTPHIVVFGDCWINDEMVLWWGNQRTKAIKQKGAK